MFIPKSVSEELLFSTVRIQIHNNDGGISSGTGFFFTLETIGRKDTTFIVTNKHVVEDGKSGVFTLHEGHQVDGELQPTGSFFDVKINELEKHCIFHPDPDIDLCAISTKPLENEADKLGKDPFAIPFDPKMIMSDSELEGLRAIEDVILVGYPLGLWDEHHNLPLLRRGITSSHPSVDYCGKSITVIDAACFPGSSGSPVSILNEGIYSNKSGMSIGSRMIFLGVLFSGPVLSIEGQIEIREIPTRRKRIVESTIPIHLGYIIKAKEVLRLLNV